MAKNLKDIKIEGSEAMIDSFAACIAAAISYWGRGYEYEYVAGLSGAVFSPAYWTKEDCAAWWMEFGNDRRIKFLGKALGFHVRESPAVLHDKMQDESEMSLDMKRFWQRVKEAVEENKVVIMGTWPCWSIVNEWNDDVTKLGLATVDGPVGELCKPYWFKKVYILTEGPATFTRKEAIRGALRMGADIADGTYTQPDFKYGGKLYDEIIVGLEKKNFCESCGEKSCSCVARTMSRIHGAASGAVDFLEMAGIFFGPELPKPALESVMGSYGKIAETSKTYADSEVVCDNWADNGFRSAFKESLMAIQTAHHEGARIFRRMVEGI